MALVGTPFFAGFYSKESIIEAVRYANVPGAGIAYVALLAGVFVTAFYSFRMYFLVFHGKARWAEKGHGHAHGHDAHGHDDHGHGDHGHHEPHESPAVVWVPLVLLAVPSVLAGLWAADPMVFGDFFKGVITVFPEHPAIATITEHWHGWVAMGLHGFVTLPFFLMLAGIVTAWYFYLINPAIPARIQSSFSSVYKLLENKYYLDAFNEKFFAGGARALGTSLWKRGDQALIDGAVVNGSARLVGFFAGWLRTIQSGLLNQYAIAMIVGVAVALAWFILAQR